jgi:cytochrome c peroxidase
MGSASIGDAASRIAGDKDYQTQSMQAFGRDVNEQDMLSAIAAYERTLASFDSPFDHFIAGDANAISDSAKRGWELFNGKARCHLCHALTDNQLDTPSSWITIFTTLASASSGITWPPWRRGRARAGARTSRGYRHCIDHERDVGPRALPRDKKAE